MIDIAQALIENLDFFRINIEADHGSTRTRELKSERESDVAKADDCDIHDLKNNHVIVVVNIYFAINMSNIVFLSFRLKRLTENCRRIFRLNNDYVILSGAQRSRRISHIT